MSPPEKKLKWNRIMAKEMELEILLSSDEEDSFSDENVYEDLNCPWCPMKESSCPHAADFLKRYSKGTFFTTRRSEPNIEQERDDSQAESDGSLNPLSLPNVLSKVLEQLTVHDLKMCRLVNKFWNIEACRVLRVVCPVTFSSNRSIRNYFRRFAPNLLGDDDLPHPHSLYQFYGIFNFDESNLFLTIFLATFGPQIKTLNLQLKNNLSFSKLKEVLLHNAPNLESLWLRCLPCLPLDSKETETKDNKRSKVKVKTTAVSCHPKPTTSGSNSGHGKVSRVRSLTLSLLCFEYANATNDATKKVLTKLLELLPNLLRITLSEDTAMGLLLIKPIHCRIITQVITELDQGRLKYLNTLDFPLLLNDAILSGFLNTTNTRLNDLEIILYDKVSLQLLTQFFSIIGSSLDKLSLTFAKSYQYPYEFLRKQRLLGQDLSQLKELTLRRFRGNLSFLECMPTLEKLFLKNVNISASFPINLKTMTNMRIFRVEAEAVQSQSRVQEIDSEVMGRIARAFPNLTELHFPGATDDCLRILYMDLPYLRVLECPRGFYTDSGISGLSQEVCTDLSETSTSDVVDGDRLRTNLFIGNLTRLRHLKLESNRISELSVVLGTYRCFHLESLYLKSPLITDKRALKIGKHLGDSLISLNVKDCPSISKLGRYNLDKAIGDISVRKLDGIEAHENAARNYRRYFDDLHLNPFLVQAHHLHNAPNVARVFYTRPFPRHLAHRHIFSLDDYAEKLDSTPNIGRQIQVVLVPLDLDNMNLLPLLGNVPVPPANHPQQQFAMPPWDQEQEDPYDLEDNW